MIQRLFRLLQVLVFFGICTTASAHEMRPAFLELKEVTNGVFDVTWKIPMLGETMNSPGSSAPNVAPQFPSGTELLSPMTIEHAPGAIIRRTRISTGMNELAGSRISIEGLDQASMDALVRIEFLNGNVFSQVLRPDAPYLEVQGENATPRASGYLILGVEHILLGIDHLLFVTCLLLLVHGKFEIFRTITAFTLAHSITLGLAALGFVQVPSGPVEATIALSIVFLAVEIVKEMRGEKSITSRRPWLVAFIFGLLHGFGFAGALSDIGLPNGEVPLALFLFNVGVELGQIVFVLIVGAFLYGLKRVPRIKLDWWRFATTYCIGSTASYWLITRVIAIW